MPNLYTKNISITSGAQVDKNNPLPPGQKAIAHFPRFGLSQFANRIAKQGEQLEVSVTGDVAHALNISPSLQTLTRIEQQSDFHCVTTWTFQGARWSGYRFADVFSQLIAPQCNPHRDATFIVFRCHDGYAPNLLLSDLLADDVLLADRLNDQPLSIEHGAPLRLVAPAHYGYKNAKHLKAIEFRRSDENYRRASFKFMDHPRARVALEERGRYFPNWILRYLYRPLVRPTIRQFQAAMDKHRVRNNRNS